VEAPKLPAVEAPKLPAVEAPKLPAVEAPKLPAVEAPKLPAVVESSIPLPVGSPTKVEQPALPQIPAPMADLKPKGSESSADVKRVAVPSTDPCPAKCEVISSTIVEPANKSWRPGDKLQAWLLNRSAAKTAEPKRIDPALAQKSSPKAPFSTAVASPPLSIPTPASLEHVAALPPQELPKLQREPVEKKIDPLLAPEKITPNADIKPAPQTVHSQSPAVLPPAARPNEQWPLNSQSILAAQSGVQGPVVYVPYPVVTVPQPHHPPVPPAPKLPSAPQLNAYVNAFTPPPAPPGQPSPASNGNMPPGNPMMAQHQQMMHQQMMQQQMMYQQMMQQQMAQQRMMPQGNPMATNAAPKQAPMIQNVSHQLPMPAQATPASQQIEQLIRAMRESPYPSQREWAAQQLVSFDCRVHPQVLQAIVLSARHDPAVSVRAGCVYCLGRMQVPGDSVLSALQAMRNDNEPRVRDQVEQALVRLGQAPAAAQ
jgi:hypothetical protein